MGQTKFELKLKHFCIRDIKPLVWEILHEIKNDQIQRIATIHLYHFDNSKTNGNAYFVYIINIDDISYDICDIILDYLSNVYPRIEYKQYRHENDTFFRRGGKIIFWFGRAVRLSVTWLYQKKFSQKTTNHLWRPKIWIFS